jgi:hypothetical protein
MTPGSAMYCLHNCNSIKTMAEQIRTCFSRGSPVPSIGAARTQKNRPMPYPSTGRNSQKILEWSKFFVSELKSIYIYCACPKFCARPKDEFHTVNSVILCRNKIFWSSTINAIQFLLWPKTFWDL